MRLKGRHGVGGVARSADEEHRSVTTLELFYDLCFVVAVAQASAELSHLIVERRFADAVIGYAAAFFGTWWAWVNYVWFASGHDSDDTTYRLLTLVQMAGVLVFAAGVHDGMVDFDMTTATIGYVIMRLGMVAMWLRVARDQPAHRRRALRYAAGVTFLQILWILRLALADDRTLAVASFFVLALAEMAWPVIAERATPGQQFHPGHLAERFGLFFIIVLGEAILSSTVAVREAIDAVGLEIDVLIAAAASLVSAFAIWWAYFGRDNEPRFDRFNGAFIWGYGHLPVFAGIAAFGAGVHVAVEAFTGVGSQRVAAVAVTLPVATAVAGFTLLAVTTGSEKERTLLVGGSIVAVVIAALGVFTPLKVALVGMAVTLVVATVAQGAALGRRVGLRATT
jgi:low temperature requirement protein LtrA